MTFKNFQYIYVEGISDVLYSDLRNVYNIDELDVEDVFTDTQLSKVEFKQEYMYIALQFPEYDEQKRHFYIKKLHCFIKQDLLLIINENEYKHAKTFHKNAEHKMASQESSQHAFYEFLDFCITNVSRAIEKFRAQINVIENEVFFENEKRDLIVEIQITKRNLVNFQSIILPLADNVTHLMHKFNHFVDAYGIEKLDDTLDKIKKMLNNIGNFKEQMSMITETHESLIARSTNRTIKILTSVNIIFLIPTLITSFFGMNVNFGWSVDAFSWLNLAGIIILMTSVTAWAYVLFKRKAWL